MADGPRLDPRVDIGHVHLKVADIDRSLGFYRDVLGFELQQRFGTQAAFLSAGGYHHHIGLNTWQSEAAPHPRPGQPACSTRQSGTRIAPRWPMPSGAWSRRRFRSRGRATTA
jgi:catechol 2,3-dioxygenase-like lactoylglutathione lyase family enzyme